MRQFTLKKNLLSKHSKEYKLLMEDTPNFQWLVHGKGLSKGLVLGRSFYADRTTYPWVIRKDKKVLGKVKRQGYSKDGKAKYLVLMNRSKKEQQFNALELHTFMSRL